MANSEDPDQMLHSAASDLVAKAFWSQYLGLLWYVANCIKQKETIVHGKCPKISYTKVADLFVLRFYGPVNPMGSCRARSVYLTTHLLGKLSPLSG